MIRIATALSLGGYKIQWISRTMSKEHAGIASVDHTIINTWFSRGILFYLEFNLRLFLILVRTKTDCINAIDLDTIPATYLAARLRNSILVHDAHEIYYEVPELLGKPLKKKIWKTVARFTLPKIGYNYTVNSSLKEHYMLHYRVPYNVIRNVPQSSENHVAAKTNNKNLVYLGVLNAGRGLEIAIEAVKQKHDYTLTLVGEGDLVTELIQQAAGAENIIFLGYQAPKDLQNILSTNAIGLNMLQAESLNYKLSLANKFFDYMHEGLPSINMNFPEYSNILSQHETGIMVDDYTTQALINALNKLENPSYFQSLSEKAIKYSKLYSWSEEQKKLLSFYRKFLN